MKAKQLRQANIQHRSIQYPTILFLA